MRRTRLPTTSSQNVCIFCAHQLGVESSIRQTSHRARLPQIRSFGNTPSHNQNAETPSASNDAQSEPQSRPSSGTQWSGTVLSDEEAVRQALARRREVEASQLNKESEEKRRLGAEERRATIARINAAQSNKVFKQPDISQTQTAKKQAASKVKQPVQNFDISENLQAMRLQAKKEDNARLRKGSGIAGYGEPMNKKATREQSIDMFGRKINTQWADENQGQKEGQTERGSRSQPRAQGSPFDGQRRDAKSGRREQQVQQSDQRPRQQNNQQNRRQQQKPQQSQASKQQPKVEDSKVAFPDFGSLFGGPKSSPMEPVTPSKAAVVDRTSMNQEFERIEAERHAEEIRRAEERKMAEEEAESHRVKIAQEALRIAEEAKRTAEIRGAAEAERKRKDEEQLEALREAKRIERINKRASERVALPNEALRKYREQVDAELAALGSAPRTAKSDLEESRSPREPISGLKGVFADRSKFANTTDDKPNMTTEDTEEKQALTKAEIAAKLSEDEERVFQELLARRSGGNKDAAPQEKTNDEISPTEDLAEARTRNETTRYKPFDPALTANWDILKDRRARDDAAQQGRQGLTAEEVTASFEKYRQQRNRSTPAIDFQNMPVNMSFPQRNSGPVMCFRCEQTGHIAANCPNEPVRPCPRCGEKGHTARECTKSRTSNVRCFNCGGPHVERDCPRPRDTPPRVRTVNKEFTDGHLPLRIRNVREDMVDDSPFAVRDTKPKEKKEDDEDVDEDEDDDRPSKSALRMNKFVDDTLPDRRRGGGPRRSRSDGNDDEDVGRSRRGRKSVFDEDEDDREGFLRRRRASRYEEDDDDGDDDFGGLKQARDERKKARQAKKQKAAKEAEKRVARSARRSQGMTPIQLPEFISVSRLAQTLGVKLDQFERKMDELGFTNTTHDHVLSSENAGLIAMEYNFDAQFGEEAEKEERDLVARPEVDDKEFLPSRPPIVTIMGHVDHGKTTILDYLRKSSVAATEHGGITQHIGAFSVNMAGGKLITFLDTPGHEAFLSMRQRGANVTDIVILVVAADDSVKPQTLEALRHAKAAKVPIIVAINKVDKEEADIERVKQDLARHGVEIEDYGGDTQVVCVSGKTGQGMDEFEEAAVTLSEILDHRAETDGPVEGWIIEATTKPSGRVATVLVRRGTLKTGDIVVAGQTWARVRTLHNEAGVQIDSAPPGTPVEIDGWREQPLAGDQVLQAPNEQKAADVVDYRVELSDRTRMATDMEAVNEQRRLETEKREADRLAKEAEAAAAAESPDALKEARSERTSDDPNAQPAHQTVPFIIKADVSGSVEAVVAYLLQMTNAQVSPTVLRSGVGAISEFDIEHAATANGHIIAFNLSTDSNTVLAAERRGVKVLDQNIIYRIVDDVKAVLEKKLTPLKVQRVLGEADVAMAFDISLGGRRKMTIAGCRVRNGVIGRNTMVRVFRGGMGGKKVYEGTITSLKNVKKDVTEMRKGTECGIGFDGWEGMQEGDIVQTFDEREEKRTLNI